MKQLVYEMLTNLSETKIIGTGAADTTDLAARVHRSHW